MSGHAIAREVVTEDGAQIECECGWKSFSTTATRREAVNDWYRHFLAARRKP